MHPQLKLAKRLQKDLNKEKYKKRPKTVEFEQLPLSNEMSAWLSETLDCIDADGFITTDIAAVNAPPHDSMSVFCPSANIIQNAARAAPRAPESSDLTYLSQSSQNFNVSKALSTYSNPMGRTSSSQYRSTGGYDETTVGTKPVNIAEAIDRMEVMWLQRRAKFEADEGDMACSLATLEEAVQIHIGNTDNNYDNAKLFDEVLSADPTALFQTIENEYVVYDVNAHFMAGRIQRWYHKHYLPRVEAAKLVARVYRGHLVRRKVWRHNHVLGQCATAIQRCFRIHLIRMHRLATRIKIWYRLCKIRKDYYQRLYRYRMARRIQRLWRGCKGRKKAMYQRNIRRVCSSIQRNARGYILRKRRAFVISMYHRMYYRACRTIQCLVRRMQAITRAQSALLTQLTNEEDRLRREKLVCDEAVHVEMRRVKMYLDTAAGRKHLEYAAAVVTNRDMKFEVVRGSLMPQDVLGHEALVAYEMLDKDGSGFISKPDLYRLLRVLGVPVHESDMDELATKLEADSLGNIDFNVFLDWYSDGNAQVYSRTIVRSLEARFLRMNKRARVQALSTSKRAEVELIRQRCSWIVDTAKTLFRHSSPPKFQCCRCLAPFVLFTDYYVHFSKDRTCRVTGERALFFRRFWIKEDWKKQRQCESEIIRLRNENRWIEYKSLIAGFTDECLLQDRAMRKFTRKLTRKAQKMHYEWICDQNKFTSYSQLIMSIVGICKDGSLSPEIAKKVAKLIRRKLPEEWAMDDIWNLSVFEIWLDSEISSRGLGGGLRGHTRSDLMMQSLSCLCARSRALWLDAHVLAKIHVQSLRAMQVSLEAAIIAQDEFRQSQPRSLSVPDEDLKRAGLYNLTSEVYAKNRLKLIRSLALIDSSLLDIISWHPETDKAGKGVLASIGKYARIGPHEEEPHSIEELVLEDAHARAEAKCRLRLHSRLGRVQVRRLAHEHWASTNLMLRQKTFDGYDEDIVTAVHAHHLFELFSSIPSGQGIDKRDFVLLERMLGINVRSNSDREALLSALDTCGTGRIDEKSFIAWIVSNEHMKYRSYWRTFVNIVTNDSLGWMGQSYKINAKHQILLNLRRLCRLEMELTHARMSTIIPLVGGGFRGAAVETELQSREELEADLMPLLSVERMNDERGELSLLHRLAADDAEIRCRREHWAGSGRRRLRTEKLIVASARQISFAYGCCLNSGKSAYSIPSRDIFASEVSFIEDQCQSHWGVFVKPILLAFDTDCTGTFDEYELSMVMRFVHCKLSEKTLLLAFPEVKSGSVTLERITTALGRLLHSTRAKRNRFLECIRGMLITGKEVTAPSTLHISTKSDMAGSSAMLISLSRQYAWELSQTASVATHSEAVYSTIDQSKNEQSLLLRCQMLAMRQVTLYLRTVYGRLHYTAVDLQSKKRFNDRIGSNPTVSGEDIVLHAYSLHMDWKGMLVTELPHLVRYLVVYWKAQPLANMSSIARLIVHVKGKQDLFWLSESDVLELVLPALKLTAIKRTFTRKDTKIFSRRTRCDATVALQAQARQQALLIALSFKEMRVAETNYRCYVLGLRAVIDDHAQRARWGIIKSNLDNCLTNWKSVPREALTLRLLAKGYTLQQLCTHEASLSDIISTTSFKIGQFSLDLVDVTTALTKAYECIFKKQNVLMKAYCVSRCLRDTCVTYVEYERTAKALTLYHTEVEAKGSEFLKEILSGVSHCITKQDV